MLRRSFLRSLLGGAFFGALGLKPGKSRARTVRFDHGVASGDPLQHRVVIWTRVSGSTDESIAVRWQVASDAEFRRVLRDGEIRTGPERDFTVKVDVGSLPAAAALYYRFEAEDEYSPTGRTRTLPHGSIDIASFAVLSCSNHPYGHFHVYREVANRDDIDAVLHLGDYIYEYGMGEYATERAEELDRVPEPSHEIVSLDDYRTRYAQYRSDPDLAALHARHPVIAIWDDHELANNAWRAGAQNHKPDEGRWEQRRDDAIQAWLEWMPVRVLSR